jgi:hypothetical protein
VDPQLVVEAFGVGAALLGFWAVARFPRFGPQSVLRAFLLVAAIFLAEAPLPSLTSWALDAGGAPFALLFVLLPALTLLFWVCGCLVRSLISLIAAYRP